MRGDISKADSIPADAQAEAVSVEKQQVYFCFLILIFKYFRSCC